MCSKVRRRYFQIKADRSSYSSFITKTVRFESRVKIEQKLLIENGNTLATLDTFVPKFAHAASAACVSAIEYEIGLLAFMIA